MAVFLSRQDGWPYARRLMGQHLQASWDAAWAPAPPLHGGLPEVRLYLADGAIETLVRSSRKGEESKLYLPAYYREADGAPSACKVTLRGANDWHHSPAKPSFRVKIKKSEIRAGRRFVELSRPEDALALCNWLPEELGREMGVVTGVSDHVAVYINNHYAGLYLRSHRLGEDLALANSRLNGTFFKGDRFGGGELWREPEPVGWKLTGDEADLSRLQDLRRLVAQPPTPELIVKLWDILDFEQYASFVALTAVTGTGHVDSFHNQNFFYDSTRGRLEPVVWDFNSYGINLGPEARLDSYSHQLLITAGYDPRWRHLRNQKVYELLHSSASLEAVRARVDTQLESTLPYLRSDPKLGQLRFHWPDTLKLGYVLAWLEPVSPSASSLAARREQFLAYVEQRNRFLEQQLGQAYVSVEPWKDGGSQVTCFGVVAVDVFSPNGVTDPWDQTNPSQRVYPGLSKQFERVDEPGGAIFYHSPAPLVYFFKTPPESLSFRNAITGEAVQPSPPPAAFQGELFCIHPWFLERLRPKPRRSRLGPGIVRVDQDLVVEEGQTLEIAPGTRLLMGPDVSLYGRGKLLIQGTRAAPVEIAAATERPWGCLGLQGAGSAGSQFRHLRVSGGSRGRFRGIRFQGMVNVYTSSGVVMEECEVGPNQVGDVSVSLAETGVVIRNCRWREARAHGLDLDRCQAVIEGCAFSGCGKAGLTVRTSRVKLGNTTFADCGDKALSVGEGSLLTGRDLTTRRCNLGVEVRDSSRAALIDCRFEGNQIGVACAQEKWLFPVGGSALLWGVELVGNQLDLKTGGASSIELCQTTARATPEVKITRVPSSEWHDLVGD
ncbi:MAG: CotH kinase family protein [Vulcanimicrobiota bacterium]